MHRNNKPPLPCRGRHSLFSFLAVLEKQCQLVGKCAVSEKEIRSKGVGPQEQVLSTLTEGQRAQRTITNQLSPHCFETVSPFIFFPRDMSHLMETYVILNEVLLHPLESEDEKDKHPSSFLVRVIQFCGHYPLSWTIWKSFWTI